MCDMAAEVPQELIIEILSCLPVKILLRFRCLSKSLCGIIDSPYFINLNLTKTSNNRTHRKIINKKYYFTPRLINTFPSQVFDIDSFVHQSRLISELDNAGCIYSYSFFGHCNGLVVLLEHNDDTVILFLWNPSTRKCRKLPVLRHKHILRRKGACFGYDSSIDDYKVMFMTEKKTGMEGNIDLEKTYELRILQLRSGFWRRIEVRSYFYFKNFRNCFADGAFYFIRYLHGDDCEILTFDLAKETFSDLSFPDSVKTRVDSCCLQVVEGCLCVTLFSRNRQFELYARKKNGGDEFSWNKLFSISLNNIQYKGVLLGQIMGFSKGGSKMYILEGRIGVCSYDFKDKKMERIIATGEYGRETFFCIESLVWINKKNRKRKKTTFQKQSNILFDRV
ncbi:F-box and associated interaction domains-containing protein [Euphorbia peplus]|nr:F-box and associated interaction domains-containing protein [Euphorbia peplus]